MSDAPGQRLLEALLDSWDRNNAILVNLLRALPEGGLEARAMEGSPSVAELFTHIHYVRLVFVFEDAPEFAGALPEQEWVVERDRDRIAQMLNESAKAVRDAVRSRVESGRDMDLHYDHPILLLQHMLWHEGYHHGQVKLALKVAGSPLTDEEAGPGTWGVWMRKSQPVSVTPQIDSPTLPAGPPVETVVFVCAHGAAKSVLAGSYFNLLAERHGLRTRAIARGTDPDPDVSERVRAEVDAMGAALCAVRPILLTDADVASADLLVAFDLELPLPDNRRVSHVAWDALPALSQDFERGRTAIVARVEALVTELLAQADRGAT